MALGAAIQPPERRICLYTATDADDLCPTDTSAWADGVGVTVLGFARFHRWAQALLRIFR
jgi:hypothetical protein